MTWHDYATVVSIFCAGLFDGNGTVIRDGIPSMLTVWFGEYDWFTKRLNASNAECNPSNPFTANIWHQNKFAIIYSYCAATAFQAWKYHGWEYGVASFLILQAIEGTSFRYFYGYFFRQTPAGTFWHFIKSCNPFDLFTNHH